MIYVVKLWILIFAIIAYALNSQIQNLREVNDIKITKLFNLYFQIKRYEILNPYLFNAIYDYANNYISDI